MGQEAVSAIIFDKSRSRILLILRADVPVWVFPGGGKETGETTEKAVIREVKEETGYEVAIIRKVAEYLPVNRLTHLTHFFECEIRSGSATLGAETKAIHFFSIETLPKHFPPFYRYWVEDALTCPKEPIRKPIAGVSYWQLIKNLFLHPTLVIRFLWTKL